MVAACLMSELGDLQEDKKAPQIVHGHGHKHLIAIDLRLCPESECLSVEKVNHDIPLPHSGEYSHTDNGHLLAVAALSLLED